MKTVDALTLEYPNNSPDLKFKKNFFQDRVKNSVLFSIFFTIVITAILVRDPRTVYDLHTLKL